MTNFPGAPMEPETAADVLAQAYAAFKAGKLEQAYALGLKVTEIDPENQDAWLLCAESSGTLEEAVRCANRAAALSPVNGRTVGTIYRVTQRALARDPFLLYLGATENLYDVRSGDALRLSVPKDRALPEPYPAPKPERLLRAYRRLGLAFLGLPLAGLGAIFFAPPAAVEALRLYRMDPSRQNRIFSLVVILLAGGLWLVGLLLGAILLMHLI